MDNFEIRFVDVEVNDIVNILSEIKFKSENIISCHFFIDNNDVYEYKEVCFENYFSSPSTVYMLLNEMELFTILNDVMIIISGVSPYVEITFNFPYSIQEYSDNIDKINKKLVFFKKYCKNILLGFEPLDEQDILLSF